MTSDDTGTTHGSDQGTFLEIGGRPAVRFERRYHHSIERVWRAVTDPDEMQAWFPAAVIGERAVGAALVFDDDTQRAADAEAGEPTRADGPWLHGRVVVHDPPNVFSFTWGTELLRIELVPDGDGTVLVFTHLLSDRSVAARNGAGWHMCLIELDRLLDAPAQDIDDWHEIYDDYIDRMGPPVGTPNGNGSITWERATHVDVGQVEAATTADDADVGAWGGGERAGDPVQWEIEPTADGTVYRLTHHGVGDDAELAAQWHALLVQLDMYLAAGQLVPVDHRRWVDEYRAVL